MTTITNLVFEGGGVKGIAYAGAIMSLDKHGILADIKAVAGTSAGAITSALLACRYSASEIKSLVSSTNFKSFEDAWDPLEIPFKYGLYKGEAFLNWMEAAIAKKLGKPKATFQDFHNAGMRTLKVFSTDLNTKSSFEFSLAKTPSVIVSEAVRASMSIPLFFRAWQFNSGIPNDHIFVDGGTVYNYPINAFDNGHYNEQTLGFFLENTSGKVKPSSLAHDELLTYVKDLFDTVLLSQKIDFNQNSQDKKRTIIIDDYGISATDFGLTSKQKEDLYLSGLNAANAHFKTYT